MDREQIVEPVWKVAGIAQGGSELLQQVERGFSYNTLKGLAKYSGLTQSEVAHYLEFNRSTLNRRSKIGRFNTLESDKIYRFADFFSKAVELFEGDKESARVWLTQPVKGLGNHRPLELLGTLSGSEMVLKLIDSLEDGVFS